MNASVSVAAATSSRHYPHPRHTNQTENKVRNANAQFSSSHPKQKERNDRIKSTFPTSDVASAVHVDIIGDYHDTHWFKASEGDLAFAQWLLGRCNGVGDTRTPQFANTVKRMFALFKIQRKLRREVAMSSKIELKECGEDAEEEEQEVDNDEPLWPVEEIVEQVGFVVSASKMELLRHQREAQKSGANVGGCLERIVVREVVENATELILSRATSDHELLLRHWIEILKEDETQANVAGDNVVEIDSEAAKGVGDTAAQKSKHREKKRRSSKNRSREAEELACKHVDSFLTLLMESAQMQTVVKESVTVTPSKVKKVWSTELHQLVELASIGLDEKERRLCVARDIQTIIQREVNKWRNCEVTLFGSSLTHYGSRSSDLDMCLLPNGRSTGTYADPPNVLGRRQLKRLVGGKSDENGHESSTCAGHAEQLRDMHAQVRSSIKKLVQALNTLDRSSAKGDKLLKQRRQLEYFYTQMRLLRNAVVAELAKMLGVDEPFDVANLNGKSAHLKAIVAASRRRHDDLYILRVILQRAAKCKRCEYECDLCFENVLATRNTSLLRAYASFDDRARALGLAVKHWAKQRGISDASIGFLSSYSFVLLSIFYLQVVQVVPNLQSPELLEFAHVQPVYYNDVNIAFCEDRGLAQTYYQRTLASDSSDMSLTSLLVGFFEFYATRFDFVKGVVAVRSPETPTQKIQQWGRRRAKTWRMSIQDPLETGRDLGCVLQMKGQEKIIEEFRRAHKMLIQCNSFSGIVCAVEQPAGKSEKTKQMNDKDVILAKEKQNVPRQQQADPVKRSYMLTLWSDDEELTKETIALFFEKYQRSFCIGKVVEALTFESANEATGNKNKRWEVELLTHAQNCPRVLALKTRIDWKALDGRGGRVWLHHHVLFATPPCQKCLSPEHTMNQCPPEDVGESDDDEGAGDRGAPRRNDKTQRNIRRHVLHLTLGANISTGISKRKDRRMKQQHQHHETVQHDPSMGKTKPHFARNTSVTGKTKRHGDKKKEMKRIGERHVEVAASPSALQGVGESVTPMKTAHKKKKWQQRVHYKKKSTRSDETHAAL